MSEHADLTGLALVVLAAVICGVVMTRLRQPAIAGYILAGILLGPSGFALVENREQISGLADLGVLLLLFLVGMELSIESFKAVWRTALMATVLQIAVSLGATWGLSFFFGWSLGLSILLGFVIALSSTAVVVKMLEDMNILNTPVGKVTIAVLIAQDLAFVPMVLVIGNLSSPEFGAIDALRIVLSVGILAGVIYYLGRGKKISLPFSRLVKGHKDLTPLRGLALCFGSAALTGVLGLSPAYGAFLAGLIIGSSTEKDAMEGGIRPIQSILMMAFFLSIGLLIDLDYIIASLGTVILILFMVTAFKTLLNIAVLGLAGQPWPHAFVAGVLLAQIGEFSFLLGQTGLSTGLITLEDRDLIISVTALSLLITPLWHATARRLMRFVVLGVTSGKEVIRLLFGRHAPVIFNAWDAIWQSPFMQTLDRGLSRLSLPQMPGWMKSVGGKKDVTITPMETTTGEPPVVDVEWEDVPPARARKKKPGKKKAAPKKTRNNNA